MSETTSPSRATLLEIYRIATLIKQADDRFIELIKAGQFASPYYSPRGQEPIPAAISVNLRRERLRRHHLSRPPRPARQRRPARASVAEYHGQGDRHLQGQGRVDAHHPSRPRG